MDISILMTSSEITFHVVFGIIKVKYNVFFSSPIFFLAMMLFKDKSIS